MGMSRVKREIDIDAARGFMLAWMTLVHLPTVVTPWINQPFGYISASEGFIFLSALFTGRIYYRLLTRDGVGKMNLRLVTRTLRLYGYHVLLLLFAFVVAAHYAIGAQCQALYNLLDFYFAAGPARAIRDALLLAYRPPLLDIIPLYIIFLLISPLIIVASTRINWKWIVGGSFALWLGAQFGLREASYSLLHYFFLRIPLNEMGAFDLWGWQLVWVIGMWGGVHWAKNDLPAENLARRLWVPAALIVVCMLALRYAQLFGLDFGGYAPLFDKWHVGAVRLVNCSAAAMLLIRFREKLQALAIRPLVLMGQSSLQVFSMHFLFCFLGLGMVGNADHILGWKQVALVVGTFGALLLIAKIYARPELAAQAGTDQDVRARDRDRRPQDSVSRAA
jgi:hypothetical protein